MNARLIIAGALGGAGPNIIGMAQQAARQHPDPALGFLYSDFGFWVGTITLAIAGLLIVFLNQETDIRKALVLGASAPAIILGWAQGTATESRSNGGADVTSAYGLVSIAYAAQSQSRSAAVRGSDSIKVNVAGLDSTRGLPTDLVAIIRSGTQLVRITYSLRTAATVTIPGSASEVYVQVGKSTSNRITVADTSIRDLNLRVSVKTPGFTAGLTRAFGFRSATAQVNLIAQR